MKVCETKHQLQRQDGHYLSHEKMSMVAPQPPASFKKMIRRIKKLTGRFILKNLYFVILLRYYIFFLRKLQNTLFWRNFRNTQKHWFYTKNSVSIKVLSFLIRAENSEKIWTNNVLRVTLLRQLKDSPLYCLPPPGWALAVNS